MIAAPSPGAVVRAVRGEMQRALSCVTADVLTAESDGPETKLRLAGRIAQPGGNGPLTLTLRYSVAVVHDASVQARARWQARTTGYMYTLDAGDGREILAYHWHPAGRSPVTRPHLHLGAAAGPLRSELQKAHLGTGFVTPVALLTLVIEAFGVRPRRTDWVAVLARADRTLTEP